MSVVGVQGLSVGSCLQEGGDTNQHFTEAGVMVLSQRFIQNFKVGGGGKERFSLFP